MKIDFKFSFKPRFFQLFQKGQYNKTTFREDLIAGIIVGIIALPLAIAFGIASGVTPQQGLITAIIAGLMVSLFGSWMNEPKQKTNLLGAILLFLIKMVTVIPNF